MINFKRIVKKVSDFLLENKQFDIVCTVTEKVLVNGVTMGLVGGMSLGLVINCLALVLSIPA